MWSTKTIYSSSATRAAATTSTTVLISGIFFYFFKKRPKIKGGRAVRPSIYIVIIMRPSRCCCSAQFTVPAVVAHSFHLKGHQLGQLCWRRFAAQWPEVGKRN